MWRFLISVIKRLRSDTVISTGYKHMKTYKAWTLIAMNTIKMKKTSDVRSFLGLYKLIGMPSKKLAIFMSVFTAIKYL